MREPMDTPVLHFGELRKLCAPVGFISLRIENMPFCSNFFNDISKVPDFYNEKYVYSLGCVASEFVVEGEQIFIPCLEMYLSDEPGRWEGRC